MPEYLYRGGREGPGNQGSRPEELRGMGWMKAGRAGRNGIHVDTSTGMVDGVRVIPILLVLTGGSTLLICCIIVREKSYKRDVPRGLGHAAQDKSSYAYRAVPYRTAYSYSSRPPQVAMDLPHVSTCGPFLA